MDLFIPKGIEKLARQDISFDGENHLGTRKKLIAAYVKGFKKCEELNQKTFTKRELVEAVELARQGFETKKNN